MVWDIFIISEDLTASSGKTNTSAGLWILQKYWVDESSL